MTADYQITLMCDKVLGIILGTSSISAQWLLTCQVLPKFNLPLMSYVYFWHDSFIKPKLQVTFQGLLFSFSPI
jgi:hypothetical protein